MKSEALRTALGMLKCQYSSEKTALSAVYKRAAHTVGVTGSSPVPPIRNFPISFMSYTFCCARWSSESFQDLDSPLSSQSMT